LKAADTVYNSLRNGRGKQEGVGKKRRGRGKAKRKTTTKYSTHFISEKAEVSQ
jgi:hypothetical protein